MITLWSCKRQRKIITNGDDVQNTDSNEFILPYDKKSDKMPLRKFENVNEKLYGGQGNEDQNKVSGN